MAATKRTEVIIRQPEPGECWHGDSKPDEYGILRQWDDEGKLMAIEFPGEEVEIRHYV